MQPIASPPPTGVLVRRSDLPTKLLDALAGYAHQYAGGQFEESGSGDAQTVRFRDGTIWFPKGLEKDNPLVFLALLFGIGSFVLSIVTIRAFREEWPFYYLLPLAVIVGMFATRFFWRTTNRREQAAVRKVAMGTVAMADCLLLVAYEDAYLFPKERIREFMMTSTRTGNTTSHRLVAVYLDDAGQLRRSEVGFTHGGNEGQKRQVEQVHAALDQWLAQPGSSPR